MAMGARHDEVRIICCMSQVINQAIRATPEAFEISNTITDRAQFTPFLFLQPL